MFKNKSLWRGLCFLCAFVMLVSSTAGAVLEKNRNMVNNFLGTQTSYVETTESDEPLYSTYVSDYANTDELIAAHRAMGERLSAEGSVLLKNNGALPLGSGSNVTLLGLCAETKMNYGARVGCAVKPSQNVKLGDALEEKGIHVNQQMRDAYAAAAKGKVYNNANKLSPSFVGVLPGEEPQLQTAEPSVADLKKADKSVLKSIADYQDAAIVVIGRSGTEAADYYPGKTGIDPKTGARNVLALTKAEKEILDFAKENFENVIVLLNCTNPMELGEMAADEGIDAIARRKTMGKWLPCSMRSKQSGASGSSICTTIPR